MVERIFSLARATTLGLTEGYVSKAYDNNANQIVGYVHGATFDKEALLAIAPRLHAYRIWLDTAGGAETVVVHARSVKDCFIALGGAQAYEQEYGDFAGLIRAWLETPERIRMWYPVYRDVPAAEIAGAIGSLR